MVLVSNALCCIKITTRVCLFGVCFWPICTDQQVEEENKSLPAGPSPKMSRWLDVQARKHSISGISLLETFTAGKSRRCVVVVVVVVAVVVVVVVFPILFLW